MELLKSNTLADQMKWMVVTPSEVCLFMGKGRK